jgi:hypothetical protein
MVSKTNEQALEAAIPKHSVELKEYKTTLINSAVKGKIRVPGVELARAQSAEHEGL